MRRSLLLLLLVSPAAWAYIGPGAGLSLLGSLVGVIGVVLLAGVGVLLYPIQQWRARRQSEQASSTETDEATEDAATDAQRVE